MRRGGFIHATEQSFAAITSTVAPRRPQTPLLQNNAIPSTVCSRFCHNSVGNNLEAFLVPVPSDIHDPRRA